MNRETRHSQQEVGYHQSEVENQKSADVSSPQISRSASRHPRRNVTRGRLRCRSVCRVGAFGNSSGAWTRAKNSRVQESRTTRRGNSQSESEGKRGKSQV